MPVRSPQAANPSAKKIAAMTRTDASLDAARESRVRCVCGSIRRMNYVSGRVAIAAIVSLTSASLTSACASTGGGTGTSGGTTGSTGSSSGAAGGSGAASGATGTATSGTSGASGASGASGSTAGSSTGVKDGGGPGADGGNAPDASMSGADAATGWTCPSGFAGKVPTLAGATVTRIAGVPPADTDGTINGMGYGFSTIEGPVWMGTSLFVSEFPGSPAPPPSRILEITPAGTVTVAGPSGWNPGSNGLAVDQAGVLYGAIHADGSISTINLAAGTRTPIASTYNGNRFNSPNDLTIRSDGNIYFSDPNYQASSAPSGYPQGNVTGLYRIAAGTHAVTLIDGTLNQPNGVTLSLDEKTLYVSSKTTVVSAYPVDTAGAVGAGTVFVSSMPNGNYVDGMVMDCAGNLYGAEISNGSNAAVVVFSPTGSVIGTLAVPNTSSASNVAFGGADHKTLYITSQGSGGGQTPPGSSAQGVYQVTLDIPGMPY